MTGPEHYLAAEASHTKAQGAARQCDGASAVLYMQAAQYHATMALAAGTVFGSLGGSASYEEEENWRNAIFNKPDISGEGQQA